MARIPLSCGSRKYAWLLAITALLALAGCRGQDARPLAHATVAPPTRVVQPLAPTSAYPATPSPRPPLSQPIVVAPPRPLQDWRIAFIAADLPNIYLINADGSGKIKLPSDPGENGALAWSADGEWLAFDTTIDQGRRSSVYKMRADGSQLTRLTNGTTFDMVPTWSRDGQWIAFSSAPNIDSPSALYKMRADGSDRMPIDPREPSTPALFSPTAANGKYLLGGSYLLTAPFDLLAPSRQGHYEGEIWSPDLGRLAFVSDHDGNREIYTVTADGQDLRRLTNNPAEDHMPAWSPNGRRIAFVSQREGSQQLYVMDVDGSHVRRVSSIANAAAPAWSPDGQYLAFNTDTGLVVVGADGRGEHQLPILARTFVWAPQ